MTALSASLYAADPLRLAEQAAEVAPHVAAFHIDIMDGMFTPDFGLNARLIRALIAGNALPLDVHLMVRDPVPIAARYAELGLRSIAVHLEAEGDIRRIATDIRSNGVQAFAAIRHATEIGLLRGIEDDVDGFLLLTAPAGGGAFQADTFERLSRRPASRATMVDGRIVPAHFPRLAALGVDIVVMGAALFEGAGAGQRAACMAQQLAEARHGALSDHD